jgi:hypothetical protein
VKCKNRACDLPSRHAGRCMRLTGAINTDHGAINRQAADGGVGGGISGRREGVSAADEEAGSVNARSPNRRSREVYNEYMRGYMRRRRSVAS